MITCSRDERRRRDKRREREEFFDNKKNCNSHALELTRRRRHSSLVSFLSRSFCLNCRLSSRELPSQQERGSCDARGRKTGRLRARVRKKDEARQAQTENMATMVLFSGHHCMAASVLPPRMRATKNSLHAGGSNRLYRSASIWQQIAPEWPAGRAYKR